MGRDVWLYARISEDRLGLSIGVNRQLREQRDLADRNGDRVVAEFRDDDRSALTEGNRPDYERLLAGVADGSLTPYGYAYQQSRLWRNRAERAQAIDVFRRRKGQITMVRGPMLDFTTAYGRGQVGLMGEFDTMESEVKSERVIDAVIERANRGKANARCPYGWRRERVIDARGNVVDWHDVVDEPAAQVVREIVRRLLRGESVSAIASDLTRRGAPTPGGQDGWYPGTVTKLALRPINVGLLVFHRGREDERYLPAATDPIISEADHASVCALLGNPARQTNRRPGGRVHLLTYGVGECGVCGGSLAVAGRKGAPLYVCRTPAGCVGRSQARVDVLLREVVCQRLERPDATGLLSDSPADDGARREVDGLRARLAVAADSFAAGRITMEQLERINDGLLPALADAESRLPRPTPTLSLVTDLAGDGVAVRWDALPVASQRAVLEALRLRVVVMPTRQGRGFRPEDVKFLWPTP